MRIFGYTISLPSFSLWGSKVSVSDDKVANLFKDRAPKKSFLSGLLRMLGFTAKKEVTGYQSFAAVPHEKVIADLGGLFDKGDKAKFISALKKIELYKLPEDVSGLDGQMYGEHVEYVLSSCIKAFHTGNDSAEYFHDNFLMKLSDKEMNELAKMLWSVKDDPDSEAAENASKGIRKWLMTKVCKVLDTGEVSTFKDAFEIELIKNVPAKLQRDFEIGYIDYRETTENCSMKAAVSYLNLKKGYESQIGFINDIGVGSRPSHMKVQERAQGATVNAKVHTLNDRSKSTSLIRSGAFTVQNKKIVDENKRKDFCIAQALPVIHASVKLSLQSESSRKMVARKGFLHVQQSLKSDRDCKEAYMILETEEALKFINDHVKIQLVDKEDEDGKMEENNGEYILKVYDENSGLDRSKNYAMNTAFFTMGVLVTQDVPSIHGKDLQTKINEKGAEQLAKYADGTDHHELATYLKSYCKSCKPWEKDVDLIGNMYILCERLGGQRGISCKSGKDRTAMEIARSLAANFTENSDKIREKLQGGISYILTMFNTGSGLLMYALPKIFHRVIGLPEVYQPPSTVKSGIVPT